MGVEPKSANESDEFPVGMRVLAVDDDPACLKILEALLRKCQYHVTTTNQAVLALQMLREKKEKFDLVISDVCMPDMDGFKLLEHVGLEMDLPVIMLSSYGDTKHVTKGIYHGACDYLLKPVRIEELKLIWQHVIRRKIGKNRLDEVENVFSDKNEKPNKRRKDSSAQKKPRLSWTKDLHNKFVAAVKHLGVDKAIPTSILKVMNVENLTKQNVASHLQKYRGYLKRISHEENQKGNMVISPNGRLDFAYLPTFIGYENPSLGSNSYPPNNLIGESSTPSGMGIFGISSLPMIQENDSQKLATTINLQEAPNVVDESILYPVTQNALGNLVCPIQSSCYVSNDGFTPMGNNVEGMIPPYSTTYDGGVGSLEDIAAAMMREEKGKGKVIVEGHSGYYDEVCYATSENYIYT
ncbi:hypothetical protein Lser_V15G22328 [Lactuca serriola]